MAELKLPKLPDRTPVQIKVSLPPDLHARLGAYLTMYRATYSDDSASLTDLIPAMLSTFLDSDRAFTRRRKEPSQ